MTPKAFHALFGRIGARAGMPFAVHPHAASRLRLRLGERRSRYSVAASLPRPQEYSAHGALYRVGTGSVQGLLAIAAERGTPPGRCADGARPLGRLDRLGG
jgi:hypothetical protein